MVDVRDKGKCRICLKPEVVKGYCQQHREEHNARQRLFLKRRKERGECQGCGKPDVRVSYCKECLPKKNECRNRSQQRRNQAKLSAGLCVVGGCSAKLSTKRLCERHRQKFNSINRAKRAKARNVKLRRT